jgi:TfoX/Sxy family transcriptional regulator of competence genes
MPFDEALAQRTRSLIVGDYAVEEKRMFGGLAFMVNGHMCCGISGQDLMVRVGPDIFEQALKRPHARPMDFTGRPLRGFVYVAPEGCRTSAKLNGWVKLGLDFAFSLPPKMRAAAPPARGPGSPGIPPGPTGSTSR